MLLDIRRGRILSLNLVGSHIFEFLQHGFSQSQIADTISKEFGVATEEARADVSDFVETLRKHDILQVVRSDRARANQ